MKEYVVEIGGVEHTLQLSDEDAKARGLKAVEPEVKAAAAPKNKGRSASIKEG